MSDVIVCDVNGAAEVIANSLHFKVARGSGPASDFCGPADLLSAALGS
jgi:hypothetical protein